MPSTDLEVRCSSLELTDIQTFRRDLKEPLVVNYGGGGSYPNGTTSIVFPYADPHAGYATNFLLISNTSWMRFETDITQPLQIFYGAKAQYNEKSYKKSAIAISLATCTTLPRGLESKVYCEGKVCRAVAVRKAPANGFNPWVLMSIARRGHFCEMGGSRHFNEAGQTEEFIASGTPSFTQYSLLNLYEVPLPLF